MKKSTPKLFVLVVAALTLTVSSLAVPAAAAEKKPNILVIWGDDIGTWNISHNSRGMMGYKTMKDYPSSQTPGSFNLEKIQKQIEAAGGGQ